MTCLRGLAQLPSLILQTRSDCALEMPGISTSPRLLWFGTGLDAHRRGDERSLHTRVWRLC